MAESVQNIQSRAQELTDQWKQLAGSEKFADIADPSERFQAAIESDPTLQGQIKSLGKAAHDLTEPEKKAIPEHVWGLLDTFDSKTGTINNEFLQHFLIDPTGANTFVENQDAETPEGAMNQVEFKKEYIETAQGKRESKVDAAFYEKHGLNPMLATLDDKDRAITTFLMLGDLLKSTRISSKGKAPLRRAYDAAEKALDRARWGAAGAEDPKFIDFMVKLDKLAAKMEKSAHKETEALATWKAGGKEGPKPKSTGAAQIWDRFQQDRERLHGRADEAFMALTQEEYDKLDPEVQKRIIADPALLAKCSEEFRAEVGADADYAQTVKSILDDDSLTHEEKADKIEALKPPELQDGIEIGKDSPESQDSPALSEANLNNMANEFKSSIARANDIFVRSHMEVVGMLRGGMNIEALIAYFLARYGERKEAAMRSKMHEMELAQEIERLNKARAERGMDPIDVVKKLGRPIRSASALERELQYLTQQWTQATNTWQAVLRQLQDMQNTISRNIRS